MFLTVEVNDDSSGALIVRWNPVEGQIMTKTSSADLEPLQRSLFLEKFESDKISDRVFAASMLMGFVEEKYADV